MADRNIDTTAVNNSVRLKQQMSPPSAPAAGYESLYVISGSAHGGLYLEDSGGRLIGPFITGTAAAAGGGRTLIAEVTPTGVGTVTVASSIPGTYKKLTLEFVVRTTASSTDVNMDIALNGDTTDANYRHTILFGYGAGTTGAIGEANNSIGDVISGANSPSGSFTHGIIDILQYANTGFNKHLIARGSHRREDSSVFELTWTTSMEWENTAAITQIDLTLESGNFETSSVVRLYGEN